MLRNRVFYVLLLIVMATIYIFTNTYYTLTLLGLCIILPAMSLLLMLFSMKGLKLNLTVPGTAEKESAELTYTFDNSSIFPVARLVFTVYMENQLTGGTNERKINATVGGRKKSSAVLSMKNSMVGAVMISTRKIRVYDAFGIFSFRKADLLDQITVIYPDMKDTVVQMEKPVETRGDGSRFSPEKPGQDVSEIFAVREYVPGDEVRKIHWKLSSKIDRMMLREFSLPLNYSVFLLMELTENKEKVIDAVVENYCSLSRGLLENGINHNLAWYDAGEGAFNVREMDGFEDLDMAMSQILSSYTSTGKGTALEYYLASGYRNVQSILMYVTAVPDIDMIAEAGISQKVKTVLIYEDNAVKESAEQTIEIIPVHVSENVPEIVV